MASVILIVASFAAVAFMPWIPFAKDGGKRRPPCGRLEGAAVEYRGPVRKESKNPLHGT